ncbi:MAG: helix-turn-helix domain-containing protein [Thermocrispum sp.]
MTGKQGADISTSPLQQYFADERRTVREARGMSQDQLAAKMYVSKSLVAMVETCQRAPTRDFAKAADDALDAAGRFDRMRERLLGAEATPEWFRPWVDYEREAVEIGWFEPLLVPGLLQTEDYARALLEDGSPDRADSLLAARLERQQILRRASVTPSSTSRCHRGVGGSAVMRSQLAYLLEAPAVLQVLPNGADTYRHLEGSFAWAALDGTRVGYVDTPARGFVLGGAQVSSKMQRRWEIIRGEALPRRQSKDLILKAAEEWTSSK